MTWATPKTWTDGEIVTADMMNDEIRDRLGDLWKYTAKGDLLVASASDTIEPITVGTDGYILRADSSASGGVAWTPRLRTLLWPMMDSFAGESITSTSYVLCKILGYLDKDRLPASATIEFYATIMTDGLGGTITANFCTGSIASPASRSEITSALGYQTRVASSDLYSTLPSGAFQLLLRTKVSSGTGYIYNAGLKIDW